MKIRAHSESHLVELDDGSKWQIFPGDLDVTLSWKPDTELNLVGIDDPVSSHALVSGDDNDRVRVLPVGRLAGRSGAYRPERQQLSRSIRAQCRREGAKLVLANRSMASLEGTRELLRKEGYDAECVVADISKEDDCSALVKMRFPSSVASTYFTIMSVLAAETVIQSTSRKALGTTSSMSISMERC
jgi:hypothetical protein